MLSQIEKVTSKTGLIYLMGHINLTLSPRPINGNTFLNWAGDFFKIANSYCQITVQLSGQKGENLNLNHFLV